MATAAEVSAAVSLVYQAAIEFERWPAALLRMSDLFGGSMAALVKGDRATGCVSTLAVRSYPGAREDYAAHYHAHNIAWQQMAHVQPGASVVDWELFPREAARRNACYGEFLQRLDVHSLFTAILVKEGPFSAVATFGRSARAGDWDTSHRATMQLIAPHLRLAAEIGQRLAGIGRIAAGPAFDALAEGVIILDGAARVVFANASAEALLSAGDGMTVRHARLCACVAADTGVLQAAIAAATSARGSDRSGRTFTLQRPSLKRPLTVVAAPLAVEAAWFLAHPPAAILFVNDPEQSCAVPLPDQLRAAFGLTPTEAMVAARIFEGDGLRPAAETLGMGVTTARTHLQRIFDKTGTRKQAELVRMLARALPNLGRRSPS
jgi:DNA-binding CsgD family transcriptional regulator/PAS domain-containing protein